MRAWKELTSSALEGTARSAKSADAEQRLLSEAGWHTLRGLAGALAARIALVDVPPAPEETRPLVPRAAASRLEEILRSEERQHVDEWLEVATAVGKRVPPSLLPPLLELAAGRPDVRSDLLNAGGQRLSWLAHQNEEWAFADILEPLEAFQSGVRPARVAALAELRRRDTASALAALEQGWDKEGGDDRTALIASLEVGLGPADEPFLIRATSDGRKEVRGAARDLLAQLPGSALVGRMTHRADTYLQLRKGVLGAKLEVSPPAECDAGMIGDGIEVKPPKGIGERAHWLRQVIALVPPSHWPLEMLERGAKSEWSRPLIEGWTEAASRFPDAAWARLLIQRQDHDAPSVRGLVRSMPPEALDGMLREHMQRDPLAGLRLAMLTANRLSVQTSAAVIQTLKRALGQRNQQLRTSVLYTVAQLSARLDPAVLPQVLELAGMTDEEWATRSMQHLATTLEYRTQMRKEIVD